MKPKILQLLAEVRIVSQISGSITNIPIKS